eukprot:CCRYP_019946-RF/>CCRYP_019946-RF protein AED:0.39 eAED:0.39 QI:0/0.88/0.9/1/0.88/0.9/10/250/484
MWIAIALQSFSIQSRNKSSKSNGDTLLKSKQGADKHQAQDRYAVAIVYPFVTAMPNSPRSLKLSSKNLTIEEILEEAPGTHARDFFSLSLTSLGDAASRKRRTSYSMSKIHPWFILPRETEIIMAFGCVRAIISRKSAIIFDAHKPTIKQQAQRICENVQRKDFFTMRDGEILFHNSTNNNKKAHFEINMVEEIIREVCTMYNGRIRLYEPIVNSLMDRVSNDAFSPSGLYKLVPVKDSLQRFEMNVKGAIRCITDLLESDEDMNNLLLTEQSIARERNEVLPLESHASVELLLEEYGRQLNSILLEIDYLLQRVQSKQDILALSMDAYRNRMIRMNLYLSVAGISIGFGTAVAGFFGMNVINGLEEVEGVFSLVVFSSCLFGGGFMGACFTYLEGTKTHTKTIQNLNQIEVLNRALSDMPALDHSFELMLKENGPLTKEKFREMIFASEPDFIRDEEINYLFDLLDYSKNSVIDKDDFRSGFE